MQVNAVRFQGWLSDWKSKIDMRPNYERLLSQEDRNSIDKAVETKDYDALTPHVKKMIHSLIRHKRGFDNIPDETDAQKKEILIKIINARENFEYTGKDGSIIRSDAGYC